MTSVSRFARITGTGSYLPPRRITNHDLVADLAQRGVQTSDEWIVERTGIHARHFADEGVTSSDLGLQASLQAIAAAGIAAQDIDLIIVATSTPDMVFPSTAAILQNKLGITNGCPVFDVQAVCSGFVYALTVADAMIRAGNARRALVVGAEVFSRILDFQDRTTCVLFGDGAGAVVLESLEHALERGATVLAEVVKRAGVDPAEVSETILGQVLTAGQGQNPGRQAHILAGYPRESAGWLINQVCGSGLRSVALAAQQVLLGDATVVAAGGQESMSLSTHAAHIRAGQKMGDMKLLDTMIKDGLWDAFNNYHMGQTAENIADKWSISREAQDEFAVASQNKAEAAQKGSDAQLKQAKAQKEIASIGQDSGQNEIALEQQKLEAEMAMEQQKLDQEFQLKQEQMNREFELKREQLQMEMALKREQATAEAAIKATVAKEQAKAARVAAVHNAQPPGEASPTSPAPGAPAKTPKQGA